jgi:HEAT repeat protein
MRPALQTLAGLLLAGTVHAQYGTAPGIDDPSRRYRDVRDGANAEAWVSRLHDPRPDVRLMAVRSIGQSSDPKAAASLTDAVLDDDPRVASAAVQVLGKLRVASATDFLTERLVMKGTPDGLRHQILGALAEIHDVRASRPILDFLARTTDPDVRAAAIFALGEVGDSTIEPELRRVADEERDSGLKKLALDALDKVTGRRYLPTPIATPYTTNPLLRPLDVE